VPIGKNSGLGGLLNQANRSMNDANRTMRNVSNVNRNVNNLQRQFGAKPQQSRTQQPRQWQCGCGQRNTAPFCGACGQQQRVCPNCNIPVAQAFCPNCGTQV
jgi:membrane protease subunit (stomatin/prohibitin family)